METTTTVKIKSNMRGQVANSKGTEWMVSTYNAWQKRYPLENMPKDNPLFLMRLFSNMEQKRIQLNGVFALSFKSLLLILGLIISVKGR